MGPHGAGSAAEQLRTAEVIGTLCLAIDLGMGFPFEHGLHTTVIAMRLARAGGSTPRWPGAWPRTLPGC